MITGSHSLIYSKNAQADRAFLRDVLKLTYVDAGNGRLMFALPPSEVAVHESQNNDIHEFYFICDDVKAFVAEMKARGVECSPLQEQGWGTLTDVPLPGGGKIAVYEPHHLRPPAVK